MADGSVWAGVEEEIGEMWTGDAEVAEGLGLPVVSEVCVVEADEREGWAVRDVEAGGADDGVDGVMDTVRGKDA